jgi:hypothetical protein
MFMLFGDVKSVTRLSGTIPWLYGAVNIREDLVVDIMLANMWNHELVLLASLADVTMLQFLPWQKSRVYVLTEGYSTSLMMRMCHAMKTTNMFFVFVSQCLYLANNTTYPQVEALIAVNIICSLLVTMSFFLVHKVRGEAIVTVEKEILKAKGLILTNEPNFMAMHEGSIELQNIYDDKSDVWGSDVYASASALTSSEGNRTSLYSRNPMHARGTIVSPSAVQQSDTDKKMEYDAIIERQEKELSEQVQLIADQAAELEVLRGQHQKQDVSSAVPSGRASSTNDHGTL